MSPVNQDLHENLDRGEELKPGSDRSFGFVIAGALIVVSFISWWHSHTAWHWTLPIAGVFCALALFYPRALRLPNFLWFRFGLMLHAVINPLVMGLLFFGAVTPTALVMRLRGKDLLRLRHDPQSASYWIERHPPGPAPETLKDQF